jgi:hypothetical protein
MNKSTVEFVFKASMHCDLKVQTLTFSDLLHSFAGFLLNGHIFLQSC